MTAHDASSVSTGMHRATLRFGSVVTSDFTPAGERLSISDGVREVSGQVVANKSYRSPAFAPRLPARKPTLAEIEALAGATSCDGERIELLRAPDSVRELMDPVQQNGTSLRAFARACEMAGVAARLEEWIRNVYDVSEFDCFGPWVSAGDMPTVTRDAEGLVGLHVDNRDKAANGLRHRSRRRLCINLGRADRAFLFVNWSLDSVHRNTGLRVRSSCALADAFLAAYGDYPVVWLRVRPGELYIAPTENLIHDASSLGMPGDDLTFTAFGHFRPKA